jgi:hypothetical protein
VRFKVQGSRFKNEIASFNPERGTENLEPIGVQKFRV